MKNNYCIRLDYNSRENNIFLDTSTRTDEYQDEVYCFAKRVAQNNDLNSVADVGCGSGYKLINHFPDFDSVGYDLPKTIESIKAMYPAKRWLVSDFSKKAEHSDLVICADVIEHVLNPDELIQWILSMNPYHVVFSTPNRDALCSILKRCPTGPPVNPHHIREWAFAEFYQYITKFFNIIYHFRIDEEFCQVIHCTPK